MHADQSFHPNAAVPPLGSQPDSGGPSISSDLQRVANSRASGVARRAGVIVVAVCLLGVLGLVAAATLPALFGYHTYNVKGGDAGAAVAAGSVAVAKPTDADELKVGDVIAYKPSPEGQTIVHRIIEISTVDGERLFVTQADDNTPAAPDPVALGGRGDRVVYSVPFAGRILDFANSSIGLVVLVIAPLAVVIYLLRERIRSLGLGDGEEAVTPQTQNATSLQDVVQARRAEAQHKQAPAAETMHVAAAQMRRDAAVRAPEPARSPAIERERASALGTLAGPSAYEQGRQAAKRPKERIRLHDMPLLKMVPLATALEMVHAAEARARENAR